MPTIDFPKQDFDSLIGRTFTLEELEGWMLLAKGEFKGYDAETDELKVELQDTNRPDLWCAEGIARQIRVKLEEGPRSYSFFKPAKKTLDQIVVGHGLHVTRPYVGGFKATGYTLSEQGLAQLIQTQEKLADIFGRKRKSVSIGVYRLDPIQFPITYAIADPDSTRFTPLGFDEPMTLTEILECHPKGIEYKSTLIGHDGKQHCPLLTDAKGIVLSFPPIINSREIGEVRVGDKNLFIEVTGTDLRMVLHTLNILATNFADRKAKIVPVEVIYPAPTEFGASIQVPYDCGSELEVPQENITTLLGESLTMNEGKQALIEYGYQVKSRGKILSVKQPPYRDDLMHPVDAIEDIAISNGYHTFPTALPSEFTVGGLSQAEMISDKVRELMVGFGFQETLSNILASQEDLVARMNLSDTAIIEVDNVMSLTYSCVRQWIIPSLLRVEAASSHSFYPHSLFEAGEIVQPDQDAESGTRTLNALSALLAHPNANFSEMHSYVDLLFYTLGLSYTVEPITHPSFMDGRVGQLTVHGKPCGLLGELHPQVLDNWQIAMPCAVFEVTLDKLTIG
ncbi:MAG TPA: phenylalanine--tRNA ligase subunit beta [Nitrospirales bacterium]|nr:phenylalanine--tRNA ligase subunit beta [Nitrospirales bacterium]HIO69920.1 phenylalanine--tRNA ligase subunit beta [Nitrospirales bacterium]